MKSVYPGGYPATTFQREPRKLWYDRARTEWFWPYRFLKQRDKERKMDPENESENTENENDKTEENSKTEDTNNNNAEDTRYIMDSIGELAAQVKALRLAVDGFADMGGTIRETTDMDTTVSGTPSDFADNEVAVIDDDVIRDIDNIVFDD